MQSQIRKVPHQQCNFGGGGHVHKDSRVVVRVVAITSGYLGDVSVMSQHRGNVGTLPAVAVLVPEMLQFMIHHTTDIGVSRVIKCVCGLGGGCAVTNGCVSAVGDCLSAAECLVVPQNVCWCTNVISLQCQTYMNTF